MSTHLPRAAQTAGTSRAADFWPVLLCWVAVALDGYDLVVLGVVIPTLLESGALGFTGPTITTASTLGLVGMGIGAVLIGPLTDRFGRRKSLITSVAMFSLFTIATGLAQSVGQFTTFRFLAGLGLGGCLPTALAFMSEHAPTGRGGSAITRMMTGYHVGAVLSALLALWLVEDYGWRSMFVVGGALGLLTLPFMWAKLPESAAYLRAVERRDRSAAGDPRSQRRRRQGPLPPDQHRPLRGVVHGSAARVRAQHLAADDHARRRLFDSAGHHPDPGPQRRCGDRPARRGPLRGHPWQQARRARSGSALPRSSWRCCRSRWRAGFSCTPRSCSTGIFVFSAQVLVYAFVGHLYPPEIRGTALGVAAGVGRVGAIVGPSLGGALVTAGFAYPWGFYAFTLAAAPRRGHPGHSAGAHA